MMISFRCFFPNGGYTTHRQEMKLEAIPIWIEAYKFTHPNCRSISVRVWFEEVMPDESI